MMNLRAVRISVLSLVVAIMVVCTFAVAKPTTPRPPASSATLSTGAIMSAFPKGVILAWYPGPTDHVPAGWARCDGKNGTPDLQNRYLVGADNFANITLVGNPVGAAQHRHHIDVTATGKGMADEQTNDSNWGALQSHNPPEATGTHHKHAVTVTVPIAADTLDSSSLPPSMKVQYIIKL